MKTEILPSLLRRFFHDWMGHQRNLSPQTVTSYRDSWRLFLRFVSQHRGRPVARLRLEDLTEIEVLAFLRYIENTKSVSIGTRNCRLAALRSFFRFVAEREPSASLQCAAVLRIPTKRSICRDVCYLDEAEVVAILRQPNRSTPEGQRDHALFSLLYNTGARIQEVLIFVRWTFGSRHRHKFGLSERGGKRESAQSGMRLPSSSRRCSSERHATRTNESSSIDTGSRWVPLAFATS